MARARPGEATKWLLDHVSHYGDACLIWPYSRKRGYAQIGWGGKACFTHRIMCELANGPAPADKPWATHLCGKGHEGCVNPKHLAWNSPSANAMDRIKHGNQMPAGRIRNKLTKDQVNEIRAMLGLVSHDLLAAAYSVSRETISSISTGRGHPVGKTWRDAKTASAR